MPLSLATLPEDVLLAILAHLPVPALLRIRRASKDIHALTLAQSPWKVKLYELAEAGIPVPQAHTSAASTSEELVRRALHLRGNLDSSAPVPTGSLRFDLTPRAENDEEDAPRLLHTMDVAFLPGWAGRLLITSHIVVRDGAPPGEGRRGWVIQVWDILRGGRCVATLRIAARNGMAVHQTPPSGCVRLATLELGQSESLNVYELHPDLDANVPAKFTLIASHAGFNVPLLFRGSTLVTRDQDEGLLLFNLFPPTSPAEDVPDPADAAPTYTLAPYCELVDDSDIAQPRSCMTVHLSHASVVVFRQRTIAIFMRPAPPASPPDAPRPVAPSATHRFQWRLYDLAVHERPCGGALDLFLRFDSYLPWPVNMLHHMVLLPGAGGAEWAPVPAARGAWPSHVALFARADMVLGAAGLAAWLDSDGEAEGAGAQRVATRRLYAAPPPPEPEGPGRAEGGATPAAEHASTAPGEGAISLLATGAPDAWTRLALCEEEGVLALLGGDGTVEVRSYAEGA